MGAFDFKNETFAEWFNFNKDTFNSFYKKIGKRFNARQETAADYYVAYSDAVSEILMDLHEFTITAAEYWRGWIAEESARLTDPEINPDFERYKKMQPKTLLDHCKNLNSEEKRVYDLLSAMLKTIEHNTSQIQSKMRLLQK